MTALQSGVEFRKHALGAGGRSPLCPDPPMVGAPSADARPRPMRAPEARTRVSFKRAMASKRSDHRILRRRIAVHALVNLIRGEQDALDDGPANHRGQPRPALGLEAEQCGGPPNLARYALMAASSSSPAAACSAWVIAAAEVRYQLDQALIDGLSLTAPAGARSKLRHPPIPPLGETPR